jgi:regulator of protease activity HflC (stomatin/prohibitin superfamily)
LRRRPCAARSARSTSTGPSKSAARSTPTKPQVIKQSEANKQQQINEAEGEAEAILAVATATAEGLRRVAAALREEGGEEAMQLRVAEAYIRQFGNLAKQANTLVVPVSVGDIASMISLATNIVRRPAPGAQPPA